MFSKKTCVSSSNDSDVSWCTTRLLSLSTALFSKCVAHYYNKLWLSIPLSFRAATGNWLNHHSKRSQSSPPTYHHHGEGEINNVAVQPTTGSTRPGEGQWSHSHQQHSNNPSWGMPLKKKITYNDDGIAIMWDNGIIQQLQFVFFWLVFF